MSGTLPAGARPKLARGVRLHQDRARGRLVLLAPERVLDTNKTAEEVLRRCDGERTIEAIVDDLATSFAADRSRITADVNALLQDLAAKRMVDL